MGQLGLKVPPPQLIMERQNQIATDIMYKREKHNVASLSSPQGGVPNIYLHTTCTDYHAQYVAPCMFSQQSYPHVPCCSCQMAEAKRGWTCLILEPETSGPVGDGIPSSQIKPNFPVQFQGHYAVGNVVFNRQSLWVIKDLMPLITKSIWFRSVLAKFPPWFFQSAT